MPLRKPANLPYPRLPAPTGPNFKGLSPLFLQYENGSNLGYKQLNAISIDTERPQIFHLKVIGLTYMYVANILQPQNNTIGNESVNFRNVVSKNSFSL